MGSVLNAQYKENHDDSPRSSAVDGIWLDGEAQTVNVGAAANVGGMIVFVAQAKGFFAANGIDAKVVLGSPAHADQISSGRRDGLCTGGFHEPTSRTRAWSELARPAGYTGGSFLKPTSTRRRSLLRGGDWYQVYPGSARKESWCDFRQHW